MRSMATQTPGGTTRAAEVTLQEWLTAMFRRYGPGKYVLLLAPDGKEITLKRFPEPHVETFRIDAGDARSR